MKVVAISGSLRAGSSNTELLRAAALVAPSGVQMTMFDGIGTLPHFNPDCESDPLPAVDRFREALRGADAVLISTPEYAHGVPGVLKNALDWVVGSGELIDKPVLLLNAAPHSTLAQESLSETLRVMSAMLVTEKALPVSMAGRKKLNSEGIAADPELAASLRHAVELLRAAVQKPR